MCCRCRWPWWATGTARRCWCRCRPRPRRRGCAQGQPLRDATAICPDLLTVPADPLGEAQFLTVLRRWAGRFSPWVAEEPPAGLMIDLSGAAHLYGGEEARAGAGGRGLRRPGADGAGGRSPTRRGRPGGWRAMPRRGLRPLAVGRCDRPGGAGHAVARGQAAGGGSGAAARRRPVAARGAEAAVIAPPGRAREALADLPLAALRLEADAVDRLMRLGLRRVGDIMGMPARGPGAALRGRHPAAAGSGAGAGAGAGQPGAPADAFRGAADAARPDRPARRMSRRRWTGCCRPFATSCAPRAGGCGGCALQAFRADGGVAAVEVGLARAADSPDRIRPLLHLKLDQIDAGFGIDCLRLEALATEAMTARAASRAARGDGRCAGGAGRAAGRPMRWTT